MRSDGFEKAIMLGMGEGKRKKMKGKNEMVR